MMNRFIAILFALMMVTTGAEAITYESPTNIMTSPPTNIDDKTETYVPSNQIPNPANPQ